MINRKGSVILETMVLIASVGSTGVFLETGIGFLLGTETRMVFGF